MTVAARQFGSKFLFPGCLNHKGGARDEGMVLIERYRISSKTIALVLDGERYVAHIVHEGALVTVRRFETEKLVEVGWNGLKGVMLAQDLCANAELVD